jgi:hypothetical protein
MTEPRNTTRHPLLHAAALTCHPATPTQAVQGIEVQVCWHQESTLALTYTLTGDCTRLQIPSSRPLARADDLWRHTCFEAFISLPGDPAYQEWNFSPSGEWAVYHFRRYRDRLSLKDEEFAPTLRVHNAKERLDLHARIGLPHRLIMQPLRLALSAVIEDDRGTVSYWALTHPPGKPDFHHPDAFVLEVAPLDGVVTRKETR